MKSQNSIMSKFVLVVTFLFISLLGTNALRAATVADKQPLTVIRYMGKEAELLIFDVHFNYGTEGRFRILDGEGNVLFDEKVQPQVTARRFKIATQLVEKIHFESITKGESQRKTFVVIYQVEERIHVNEVK